MAKSSPKYFRKVIRISADMSPNVALGLKQRAMGIEPTGQLLVPGVLTWQEYCTRLKTWDAIRIEVGIYAKFYEGKEVLLYPSHWLDRAAQIASLLYGQPRKALAMGVDSAAGGDDTCWAIVDELGLLELISYKTPNTAIIPIETKRLIHKYGLAARNVLFDSGGGGTQHVHALRAEGYGVRTIDFGGAITLDLKSGSQRRRLSEKRAHREERYVYKNRRGQMYGDLHNLLDPNYNPEGFGLPEEYFELRRQLAPIPMLKDAEDKLYMLPKGPISRKRDGIVRETLYDLIGCSPDEADALVLAVHGLLHKPTKAIVGAMV